MAFQDQVKAWFVTGAFPTQAQFWQKFAWLRWKDEPLPITDVDGLQDQLNALGQPIQRFVATGQFDYVIPAGYVVEWFAIKPLIDCLITLSDDAGVVMEDVGVLALNGEPLTVMMMALGDRNISITGLPERTEIFVKRYLLPNF